MDTIVFSQAIEGYLLAAQARRLSIHTIRDYTYTLRKFQKWLGDDPPIAAITSAQVTQFLASQNGISNKTLLNYYVGLSAVWTWAVNENLVAKNIVREVVPPRPEEKAIDPFSEADVRAMLAACDRTIPYTRPGKRECTHSLATAIRNKAIILLLLDTGIRASELCEMQIRQADLRNRRITVEGKGSKQRIIPFAPATGKALWRYLATRPGDKANEPLFVSSSGRPLDRRYLVHVIYRLATRAGVLDAHPHRFRHTFAVNFLRNGGNVYALQMALGHSTLDMVRKYLELAQADLDSAHAVASPVARWRL